MIQTSKRGQIRRAKIKRSEAFAPSQINETHPLGNRLTRRHQEKIDRTMLETLRKEGWQRHLKNLRESVIRGYKIRMERIQASKK